MAVNLSSDIWVFYNPSFVCIIAGNSIWHITILLQHPWLSSPLGFSIVHAKCTKVERRVLWEALLGDKPSALPWCECGNMNMISAPNEKRGGRPVSSAYCMELMTFMEEAGVFNVGFSSPSYTWCNNRRGRARIWKRLDRVLINGESVGLTAAISIVHLAHHPSNHAPLKISFASRLDNMSHAFRFLNIWTSKTSFLEVIRVVWTQEVEGSPLRILCSKLLATRESNSGVEQAGVWECLRSG